jgi:cytochrome c-type biogenesis protein CcmH
MLFWSSVVLITLAVLWTVVGPLLRGGRARDDQSADPLIAVYRDRRREIEDERIAGRIGDEEARVAIEELVAQMAVELPAESSGGVAEPRTPTLATRGLALLLAVLIPGGAALIYLQLGAPELTDPDVVAALSEPPRFDAAQVDQLIMQVEARVRANPSDGEAWLVLASARKFRSDHAGAVEAFERAVRLNPPGARMLAEFAESLAMLAQGSFAGRPLQLLEQAMGLDPDDAKAIALMGAAQYQIGNFGAARTLLNRLLEAMPPGQTEQRAAMAELLKRIDDRIATEGRSGAAPQAAASASPQGAGRADPSSGPTGDADATMISGSVSLSPALAAQAREAPTLFITARAGAGPRIPYAALRIDQPRLPLEFRLDDSLAMDPSRRLSSAGEVVIEARLSRSGSANRSAGDLYGVSEPVRPGARELRLVIDQVVNP